MALTVRADDRKTREAAITKTRDAAVAKIESDDIEGAAALVGAHGDTPKGKLEWYQESAIELITQAQILKAGQDYDGSRRAAKASIKMLAHALKKNGVAPRAEDRANLQIQMAQVYDTLLGDLPSARQAYQKALRESPDNPAAQQALATYAAADSKFERIKSRKK